MEENEITGCFYNFEWTDDKINAILHGHPQKNLSPATKSPLAMSFYSKIILQIDEKWLIDKVNHKCYTICGLIHKHTEAKTCLQKIQE